MKSNKKRKPRLPTAICDAKIVTFKDGKRVVKQYRSGQPLDGKIMERKDYML